MTMRGTGSTQVRIVPSFHLCEVKLFGAWTLYSVEFMLCLCIGLDNNFTSRICLEKDQGSRTIGLPIQYQECQIYVICDYDINLFGPNLVAYSVSAIFLFN